MSELRTIVAALLVIAEIGTYIAGLYFLALGIVRMVRRQWECAFDVIVPALAWSGVSHGVLVMWQFVKP